MILKTFMDFAVKIILMLFGQIYLTETVTVIDKEKNLLN